MKIEKLTENKIRIIVNSSDLEVQNLNINLLMAKAPESQNFIIDILEKAKKEVGFNTDGCKLLIEAFSSSDDILIFTITKYTTKDSKNNDTSRKKKLTPKRKTINFSSTQAIYKFQSFDEFCNFCEYINKKQDFNIKKFSKNISLYLYNSTYYLVIKDINTSYEHAKSFYNLISEFSIALTFSSAFENKLIEHGKIIMKKNAVTTGIKYFA